MRLAICIIVYSLLCVVLHGQIVNGVIVSGSVTSTERTPNTFFDTFNRLDSDPMSTNATDNVGVWVDGPGSLNPCKIALGNLSSSAGLDSGCMVLYPPFRPNQSASGVVATIGSGGLMVRMQSATNASGYLCSVDDATHISIYRVVDTGFINYVLIGSQETVATINSLDTVTFSIVGNIMNVAVNGVSLGIPKTDNTYKSGQPACYFYEFAPSITEFSATEL